MKIIGNNPSIDNLLKMEGGTFQSIALTFQSVILKVKLQYPDFLFPTHTTDTHIECADALRKDYQRESQLLYR